jgi:hypothetical protein
MEFLNFRWFRLRRNSDTAIYCMRWQFSDINSTYSKCWYHIDCTHTHTHTHTHTFIATSQCSTFRKRDDDLNEWTRRICMTHMETHKLYCESRTMLKMRLFFDYPFGWQFRLRFLPSFFIFTRMSKRFWCALSWYLGLGLDFSFFSIWLNLKISHLLP